MACASTFALELHQELYGRSALQSRLPASSSISLSYPKEAKVGQTVKVSDEVRCASQPCRFFGAKRRVHGPRSTDAGELTTAI